MGKKTAKKQQSTLAWVRSVQRRWLQNRECKKKPKVVKLSKDEITTPTFTDRLEQQVRTHALHFLLFAPIRWITDRKQCFFFMIFWTYFFGGRFQKINSNFFISLFNAPQANILSYFHDYDTVCDRFLVFSTKFRDSKIKFSNFEPTILNFPKSEPTKR